MTASFGNHPYHRIQPSKVNIVTVMQEPLGRQCYDCGKCRTVRVKMFKEEEGMEEMADMETTEEETKIRNPKCKGL